MIRPRILSVAAVATASVLALTACSPSSPSGGGEDGDRTVVTVRLWDEQIQKAYDKSFEAFEEENPDIDVQTVHVPWADYFTKLRTDVSGGDADDIFMINGSYIEPYIANDNLMEIGADFDDLKEDWVPAAVEQYTYDDKLWGVPALTDGGIAVYYNADLLDEAGVTPEEIADLTWSPDGEDTFLPMAQKLTVDANGVRGDEEGFDGSNPNVWGYSAAQDLQGIYYNFVGSNGGQMQDDEGRFVFDSPEAVGAFQYLVDLINEHQVSPAASNTNDNGDFTRDQFLQGKIVMFQSGVYNLANVNDGADFEWGIVPIPEGPEGRVSVVNTVVIAGNAGTANPEATQQVLRWLGSTEGAAHLGESGAAMPAVISAQEAFNDYWAEQGVDPSQFVDQGNEQSISAPSGENYGAAVQAFKPIFNEIFLGRTEVEPGLTEAAAAANEAMGF